MLDLIERERCDVFLTADKNMDKQQRLEDRPFAVLIMSVIDWPVVRPHTQRISMALDDAPPGTVATVDCGVFIPARDASVNKPHAHGQTEALIRKTVSKNAPL